MNGRTVIRLLGAVLLLGAYILLFERPWRSAAERVRIESPLLPFAPQGAGMIILQAGARSVQLERRPDGWRLTAPVAGRAAPGAVAKLLDTLRGLRRVDTITPRQRTDRGLDLAAYGLAAPLATLQIGRPEALHMLRIGQEAALGNTVYTLVDDDPDVIVTSRELLDALPAAAEDFRDRALFHGDPARVVRLEIKNAAGYVKLVRRGADWWLEQPETARADDRRVEALLRDLSGVEAVEFATNVTRDTVSAGLGEDAPAQVCVAEPGDQAGAYVWIGNEPPGRTGLRYARSEAAADVCLIPGERVAAIVALHPSELRDRRVWPVNPETVTRLRLAAGEERLTLERAGATNGWNLVEPAREPADPITVAALIRRLGALRAVQRGAAASNAAPPADWTMLVGITEGAPASAPASNSNAAVSGGAESVTWLWPPDAGRLVRVRRERAMDEWRLSEHDWRAALAVGEGGKWRDALNPAAYRTRVLLKIPSADIRRITRWCDGLEETVICERGRWTAQSPAGGQVSLEAVAAVTNWIAALPVLRFERLDAVRRAAAGFDNPVLRLSIGLAGASGIEKTLLVGGETAGGVYAAVQGQDSVAVIPAAAAEALHRALVTW